MEGSNGARGATWRSGGKKQSSMSRSRGRSRSSANAGAGIPARQTKAQSQIPNQTTTAQERSTPGDSPGTPAGQTRPLHVIQLKYNRETLLFAEC